MRNRETFQNKVAVITGGASGIGAALAQQLAAQGARVVIADRQVELSESLADAIRSSGGSAFGIELDVRDPASVQNVVHSTLARWGAVDYFFNNAGIGVGGEAAHYTVQDYDDVFDVNLRGVAYGVQAVYPVMIRQRSGHIVNTASMAGLVPAAGQIAYSASKYAVVGLSKGLRIEAKRYGVRVSVLCPGVIRTPILQGGKYGRLRGMGGTGGVDDKRVSEAVQAMFERMRPMAPDAFARQALAAVARNQAIIVVPTWWKLFWYLDRFSPTWSLAFAGAGYARRRDGFEALNLRASGAGADSPDPRATDASRSASSL